MPTAAVKGLDELKRDMARLSDATAITRPELKVEGGTVACYSSSWKGKPARPSGCHGAAATVPPLAALPSESEWRIHGLGSRAGCPVRRNNKSGIEVR
jgi:hypothetical protein